MTAPALSLMAELREAGAVLTCSADRRVRFAASVPLPADLLARARAHRDAIADAILAEDAAARDTTPDPPPLSEAGTPARVRGDAEHAQMVRGLLNAACQRPPSWSDSAATPSPGCWCSCCKGYRWWCEREAPKGWRCGTCHPPLHLAPGVIGWVGIAPTSESPNILLIKGTAA